MDRNLLWLLSLALVSFSTCTFYTMRPDRRLSVASKTTLTFREHKGRGYGLCMVTCKMTSSCCSVNVQYDGVTSTLTCEMLNVYLYEVPGNLTSASGWVFIQEDPVVTEPPWALAMRVTSGIFKSVWDTWDEDGRHDDASEMKSCVLPSSSLPCRSHFRSFILDRWVNIKLVRLTLHKDDGTQVARMTFNGQGSSRMSWLSASRVINSTWTDMVVPALQTNYFSITGMPNVYRRFYLSRLHNSCLGDIGWMMVADVFPGSENAGSSVHGQCPWELGHRAFPVLFYIPGAHSGLWASAVTADFMMLHVTFNV